jgi:UDP-glucose 4-epimerase
MKNSGENFDAYLGTRVLILGASGFIGRWVARELSKNGADLHLVVRDESVIRKMFAAYEIHGEVLEMDLQTRGSSLDLFRKVRPSITFNLAGYGVDPSERDEKINFQINSDLPKSICSAVAEKTDAQWAGQDLIHVGSALEYGTADGDLSEKSIPNPTTLYGQSKLSGTRQLAQCCEEQGIKGVTARLFTVFGPGEHDGRLLPALLESANTQNTVALTSGVQERDFTYVKDVAEGLLRLGLTTDAKPGDVVNLATGQLTSVRSFAEKAAEILGIPRGQLDFGTKPTRAEEMKHSPVSIERLRQLTGWTPGTTVEEGIDQTLRFLQQHSGCRNHGDIAFFA